jgi:ribose transport system substrate-binding protein
MFNTRKSLVTGAALAAALTLAACGSSTPAAAPSPSSTSSVSSSSEASSAPVAGSSDTSSSAGAAGSSDSMSSGSASGSDTSSAAGSAGGLPSLADNAGAGKKIVYVPGLTGVPFYSSVSCGAAAEAKRLGATFTTQGDPTFAVDKQTAIINSLVASKPDAIMISITDPKAMIVPLKQAKDAGIKIIGIDGDLTDESVMATNIQSDNIKGGALAADRLGEVMGGQGSALMVDNNTGSLIGAARQKGFVDEMKAKFQNIKVLEPQYSTGAADKATAIISAAITNNPEIKGVYTLATNNTQGAVIGIREAGKTGTVKLVGYDTSDPIIKATKEKAVDGLVVQYPLGEGMLGVQTAITLINGGTVPRNQATPFLMVTPENVDSPDAQKYIYKVNC